MSMVRTCHPYQFGVNIFVVGFNLMQFLIQMDHLLVDVFGFVLLIVLLTVLFSDDSIADC